MYGSVTEFSYTDGVFWLNKHLQNQWNITIEDLASNIQQIQACSDYIWKWSSEAMSLKLRCFIYILL